MTEQRHQRVDVLSGFSQLCVHLHTFCYFSSEERIILMCSQKLFRTNVLIKSSWDIFYVYRLWHVLRLALKNPILSTVFKSNVTWCVWEWVYNVNSYLTFRLIFTLGYTVACVHFVEIVYSSISRWQVSACGSPKDWGPHTGNTKPYSGFCPSLCMLQKDQK